MIFSVPYVCPVCVGAGEVLRQPGEAPSRCTPCEGAGIVWGTRIDVDISSTIQQQDLRRPPTDGRTYGYN